MKWNWMAASGAALAVALFALPIANAQSVSGVEGARAKARTGERLNPRQRDFMRHYGGPSRHIVGPEGNRRMNRVGQ